ncbi:MAG: hypothetical protein IJO32_05260 [Bacilli bacterium]|nr:hypothetical protein [Bacilli bacterium]
MYLDFKDVCLIFIKTLIITLIVVGLLFLIRFDYNIGIRYCEILNIPKDFALTMVSPGMAIEVAIIMFVVEMIGLYFIIKMLKNRVI